MAARRGGILGGAGLAYSVLNPLPSGRWPPAQSVRAKRAVFDRPHRPFSLIFCSRIAKPYARFQNIYFLGPYDFFWARGRVRGVGVDCGSGHFAIWWGGRG
jgi:hypothetical protein